MSRRIIWPPPAEQDLTKLADFIGRNSSSAALRFVDAAHAACQRLAEMPELGGLWESPNPRLAGVRVWPIRGFENYLLFYRPTDETIEVVRVLHGAQDVERQLGT
jgi:toxin ParE1/3/4